MRSLKVVALIFMFCFLLTLPNVFAECVIGIVPQPEDGSPITVQCEEGILQSCTGASYYSGYNGSGYVGSFDAAGDTITMNIDVEHAGQKEMTLRYMCNDKKNFKLIVNGETLQANYWIPCGGMGPTNWMSHTLSGIPLQAGSNTIVLERLGPYQLYVDQIELN